MVGYKLCRNCEYGCVLLAIVQRDFSTIFTDDKIELYTINKSIKKHHRYWWCIVWCVIFAYLAHRTTQRMGITITSQLDTFYPLKIKFSLALSAN